MSPGPPISSANRVVASPTASSLALRREVREPPLCHGEEHVRDGRNGKVIHGSTEGIPEPKNSRNTTMRHDIIQVISLLLVATAVLLTQNAEAHPPRARQAHTIIETLNRDQRTLIVSYAKGRGPHELIWNSETMFLRDRKFVTATELKEGTHAVIYYHSPFFGKPFLTKVIWTNDESTNSSAIGHWNYTRGELRISTTRMGKQFAIIVRAFAGNTGA